MYRLDFHPLVSNDFIEAVSYFKSISPEQLERFKTALKKAYQNIRQAPTHYLVLIKKRNIRRISLKGFEYSVIYTIKIDAVIVLALKHHKQRNYWKNRS